MSMSPRIPLPRLKLAELLPVSLDRVPPHTLQLPLRIHQSSLHPHRVQPITPHTLTIQQLRQRGLDLLVDLHQLPRFLLYLASPCA